MAEIQRLDARNPLPERLDTYLSETLEGTSRNKAKHWCKEGFVKVNGLPQKGSFKLRGGEQIEVTTPEPPSRDKIIPENLPLDIVYEDEDLVVINKAVGMVVHPGAGVYSGTLVHALVYHFEHLATCGGSLRPGIVHRLDKGTSGLMLVAKTDQAHHHLSKQWQDGEVIKVYQALIWGKPKKQEGEIETQIGRHPKYRQLMAADVPKGRRAKSRYKIVEQFEEACKVNVQILTGRTHQIRVHLAYLGHPVVGDAMYGKNRHKNLAKTFTNMPEHPMLHAALLKFRHPVTGKRMVFKQIPPRPFKNCAQILSSWP